MKIALKIVSIIGLLFWTACCFFGMLYAFNGRLEIAIPLALLVGVALFLSYLVMLKMQDKNATQGNRDRAKTMSFIMLGVYVVAAICSAFYINHLVKVENEYKEETKENAELAIKELQTVFGNENTADSYMHYVQESALPTYGTQLMQVSGQSALTQKDEDDMYELETWLLGTDQYASKESFSELQKTVVQKMTQTSGAVKNWNVFTSVSVLGRLKELIGSKPEYEAQLLSWVKSREKEAYPFLHDEPFVYVPKEDCSNLLENVTHASFGISITAILIMVALQVIILLGFLLGMKTGGKPDKIVTSEKGSTRSWPSN